LAEFETGEANIWIETCFAGLEEEVLIDVHLVVNSINKVRLNGLLKVSQ
jgi:hypothetical protein